MRRCIAVMLAIMIIFASGIGVNFISVHATEKKEDVVGKTYDLAEKDGYEIAKAQEVTDKANRFYVSGDITNVSTKNGFVSYAVNSGNLKIMVDEQFGKKLFTPDKEQDWHIITDKSKTVDSTKFSQNIGSGAVIIQTSKDGKSWINVDTETDIYNKMDTINKRNINGEEIKAFYETTNIQIANGCYYRIIVAYKMQREVDPSKVLFVTVNNTEEKERIEVYQFYAYDPSVNQTEVLNIKDAYEFGDVYRVDNQDGFKNPEIIKSDDPHNDWSVGKFYVSGYTDVRMDGDVPVFLKVPGDKAALWFNLEQELDKCDGRTDVKVNYISSGSDIYFGTPTINNFGRGALIVRKTDKQNQKERQIYTNYLEASATVGANTRVDLFEEGDYEVALDYQLHYDKPFVFGTKTTKTLTYRVFFKFKVRNGDVSFFLRDVDTNQFITNANVAEHGFYIDVANSQYLNISIKREVLSESMDGLVEDTRFTAVAKEGRNYTDEGVYTVTVKNLATGDSVEKKVYVGNHDIMRAHMITGISLSEINERLAAGAYIDENGQIIDPEPEIVEEELELSEETNEVDEEENPIEDPKVEETKTPDVEVKTEDTATVLEEKKEVNLPNIVVVVLVMTVLCIAIALVLVNKKSRSTNVKKDGEEE